jgi:hypothetical protein
MTTTLWSSHFKTDLYGLHWEQLSGVSEQWLVLQRLLRAFAEQAEILGRVSGDLHVVSGGADARVFEQWTMTTDAATVQAALSARPDRPEPVEVPLRFEPLVLLPDDKLEVVDFDLSDDDVIARAELHPVEGWSPLPDGLKAWRLCKQPVDLLTFDLHFGVGEFATTVYFEIGTRCDLWRASRLNGEPGETHNVANAGLLARTVEAIAQATKAEISQRPPE